jgi:uroporphyrinogen decarboxylase
MVPGLPGGPLEVVIKLVGYDALCFMLADDPVLASDIFEAVGSRTVRMVQRLAPMLNVGAIMANDDWGFRTQTLLSTADMRKYVFPWHKKIVAAAHNAGKPALLHSCGYAGEIMGDIIHDMKFNAKHSFEDVIEPIEEAYPKYGRDIALLGGIDVDFMVKSTPDAIRARARNLLAMSAQFNNYALGTGNSVPEYIPDENFFAMTSVALEAREER